MSDERPPALGEERAGEEFRVGVQRGLPAAEVRELSRLDPLRCALPIVQSWGLIAVAVAAAIHWPHPLVIALAILVVAAGQHGLAVLAHEAAHYRLFETRWLNDLAGKLCGAPLGVSMLTYRVIHRIHHNHLYQEIDPDLALMAGYPRGRAYLFGKLLKDLSGITIVKNYLYFTGRQLVKPIDEMVKPIGGAVKPVGDTSKRLRRAARHDRRLVLALHLLLLAAAIVSGGWRWYLLLWLLPLVTVLQVILRLRAVCEHGAVKELSSPLTAARTTLAPPWARWIMFPHNVNYHIEHHLYPSVPHYRLAECHRRLQAAGALEGAEVVPRFSETLRKIFADKAPI
jgi:fatty acid desaturase